MPVFRLQTHELNGKPKLPEGMERWPHGQFAVHSHQCYQLLFCRGGQQFMLLHTLWAASAVWSPGDPCPPGTRVASVWPHPRLTAGVALIQTASALSRTEYCLLPCLTNGGERAGHSCSAVASQWGRSLELRRKDENKMPAASISDFKREAGLMASWSLVPGIVGNKRPSGRQGQARAQSPIVRLHQQFSNFSY